MKKITSRFLTYTVAIFILFVCSCSTEESVPNQTLDAQTWFEKHEAESPNFELFQNLEYNWNQAKTTTSEDGTQTIIVPIVERKKNTAEIWKQKLYIYKLSATNYEALIFEIFPDKNSKSSSQSIDSGNFNGYITSWNLKNGFIKAAQFENNKAVQEGGIAILFSKNNQHSKMQADPCYYCEDIGVGGGSSWGSGVPLREVVVGGKSTGPSFPNMTYVPRSPVYGAIDPPKYTNPPHGGGGGGGGYTPVASLIEDRITTNLPPCVETIINDLKKLENGKFSKILSKFSSLEPTPLSYNWNIVKGNLPANNPGSTGATVVGGSVTSTLNENDLFVSTDLSIAKTIIHESFHAYLVSVYRYKDIDKDYVTLIDTYFKEAGGDLNATQHNIFANTNIVQEISVALQAYGNLKGYALSNQFYEDMAWGGLASTKAFNALPEVQKNRILNTIYSEYKNSNTNGISPKGKKICK